jgi:hypothetical protein
VVNVRSYPVVDDLDHWIGHSRGSGENFVHKAVREWGTIKLLVTKAFGS